MTNAGASASPIDNEKFDNLDETIMRRTFAILIATAISLDGRPLDQGPPITALLRIVRAAKTEAAAAGRSAVRRLDEFLEGPAVRRIEDAVAADARKGVRSILGGAITSEPNLGTGRLPRAVEEDLLRPEMAWLAERLAVRRYYRTATDPRKVVTQDTQDFMRILYGDEAADALRVVPDLTEFVPAKPFAFLGEAVLLAKPGDGTQWRAFRASGPAETFASLEDFCRSGCKRPVVVLTDSLRSSHITRALSERCPVVLAVPPVDLPRLHKVTHQTRQVVLGATRFRSDAAAAALLGSRSVKDANAFDTLFQAKVATPLDSVADLETLVAGAHASGTTPVLYVHVEPGRIIRMPDGSSIPIDRLRQPAIIFGCATVYANIAGPEIQSLGPLLWRDMARAATRTPRSEGTSMTDFLLHYGDAFREGLSRDQAIARTKVLTLLVAPAASGATVYVVHNRFTSPPVVAQPPRARKSPSPSESNR